MALMDETQIARSAIHRAFAAVDHLSHEIRFADQGPGESDEVCVAGHEHFTHRLGGAHAPGENDRRVNPITESPCQGSEVGLGTRR